ncbi:MAG TPA: hypothetical protein VIG74_04970, partial [Alphaproteobacteria bacterium]
MGQRLGVSESEFYMWRAVFAFALVDGILSIEEQRLLQSYLAQVPFSHDQIRILREDFKKPQSLLQMYRHITEQKHRDRFCVLARALVWCEGEMNREERDVLAQFDCIMDSTVDIDDTGRSSKTKY